MVCLVLVLEACATLTLRADVAESWEHAREEFGRESECVEPARCEDCQLTSQGVETLVEDGRDLLCFVERWAARSMRASGDGLRRAKKPASGMCKPLW